MTEITPYRSQDNVYTNKLQIAKNKLEEKRKRELQYKLKKEEEEKEEQRKQQILLAEVNEAIYPLKIEIKKGKAWDKRSEREEFGWNVVLIPINKNFYPQYLCKEWDLFDRLPILIESEYFAELIEEFSNNKLERIKRLHGPVPVEIIRKRVNISLLSILLFISCMIFCI